MESSNKHNMIKQNKIRELKGEVENAVIQLFDYIEQVDSNQNIILLLANGHKTNQIVEGFSPYVIGLGEEGLTDFDRIDFFQFYTDIPFENSYNECDDEEKKKQMIRNSLHLELMIYTHFWEAFPVLKMLNQLINLCHNDYKWDIKVPAMSKHSFIRDTIRDGFKKLNLDIHKIITKSFNSQIRNAFAHSQYSFSGEIIFLGNYDSSQTWQVPSISIVDWEEKFLFTALLFNELTKHIKKMKQSLSAGVFEVQVPETSHPEHLVNRRLRYIKHQGRFVWEK
ncbi:MAG: hypothetical protein ACI81T_002325 [Bacteroidia bacterium]|jgi:hypothetical protein